MMIEYSNQGGETGWRERGGAGYPGRRGGAGLAGEKWKQPCPLQSSTARLPKTEPLPHPHRGDVEPRKSGSEPPFDKPGAPGSLRGVFPYSRCELRRGPENFLTFLTGDPFVFPTDLRNVKTHSEIWSQRQNPSARRVTWNNGGEKSSNCSLAERWTWGFVSKLFRLQTLSCN